MGTLILDRKSVSELLHMREVIDAVEEGFRLWGEGKGSMPPKAYLTVDKGDFRAMPAALPGSVGMKWVNAHPHNREKGLPSVMAVLIYNDPDTAYPLAIMDATQITAFRTGAAGAIASKYLSRRDSKSLGIIGAGYQAYTQILSHCQICVPDVINVYDISSESINRLKELLPDYNINETTIEEAAGSDILCTLTPSRSPIVKREWIKPGTHINAVGADASGKEELDPQILLDARVIVDDIRQASGGGEINVPVKNGVFKIEDVVGTLPEVVLGKIVRTSVDDITVFDSTGIAIQDIATARLVYQQAKRRGGYLEVDLMGV